MNLSWKLKMPQKNTKNIIIAVGLILLLIIAYRIYANLSMNRDRASRALAGRVVTVEVDAVKKRDLLPSFSFSANLEAVWSADVSSKADGRIDRLPVEEGDRVKAGDILAVLDTNELAAQVMDAEGKLLQAKATFEQADLTYKRMEALYKQGGVSAQTLDSARTQRDLAWGGVKSAEGNLVLLRVRLENANIISPMDGIVVKRYVQAGTFMKAGTAIVAIADPSTMLVKANVGEAEIKELVLGSSVKIVVGALANRELNGKVSRLSPAATLPARTFTAEVSIPNLDGSLKVGMFAKAEVQGQLRQQILVVPEGCLVLREDQKTVFVVADDNKVVQQRVLKLGDAAGGWVQVLGGLKEGERIVIGGQHKLKDGATIRIGSPGEATK